MRVATISQAYEGTKEQTVGRTVELIREASKNADLVVLQELHQTDYFCQVEDTANFQLSESFDDDVLFWANIAKENSIVLVTSLFEKRAPGLYHNTAVVLDKDGSIAGKYRKMHIPDDPGFYEKFYFTPGDLGFEPIKTSIGKLGVLICWDQWYPEAARLMALKGAEVLIYPTAIGWFDSDSVEEKARQLASWKNIQISHSIANGIPVISCNRVGVEKDPSGVLEGTRFWGNSFICDAGGKLLAQQSELEETILYATLDKAYSADVRNIWPFLRDRRIDAYANLTRRFIDD